jgi:hypothetical protein
MTLGKTERLHAARMASEVLLRIILTEREREIAGHRLVRGRRWLGESISERWKPPSIGSAGIACI